jgi:hypothetical protein
MNETDLFPTINKQTIGTYYEGVDSGVSSFVVSNCSNFLYTGLSNGNILKMCLKSRKIIGKDISYKKVISRKNRESQSWCYRLSHFPR